MKPFGTFLLWILTIRNKGRKEKREGRKKEEASWVLHFPSVGFFLKISYFSLKGLSLRKKSWRFSHLRKMHLSRLWWWWCSFAKLCPALWPHGLQHARPPCPSLSPGACSDSCPSRWWCHPDISSSLALFSFCLQSYPASIMIFSDELALCIRWPQYWSFTFSISPSMNTQSWFPLGLASLVSLLSKGFSRVLIQHHSLKASVLQHSAFFMVQLSHLYITTGKKPQLWLDEPL